MTPSDIRTYLKTRESASLADLAARFDADPQAILGILSHWQRKGKVLEVKGEACSKGCSGCGASSPSFYQWQE